MAKIGLSVIEGGKSDHSLPKKEKTVPQTKVNLKTSLRDIEFLCEHFPKLDQYYHYETESLMIEKKKEIESIKEAGSGVKDCYNPKWIEFYELFLKDMEENPAKAYFFTIRWLTDFYDADEKNISSG
jgi:hypothetical protein